MRGSRQVTRRPRAGRVCRRLFQQRVDGGARQRAAHHRRRRRRRVGEAVDRGVGEQAALLALDLRIDMASDAVSEMRRTYEIYKPVIRRRLERARNPENDPPTAVWEAEHMSANPPPPALRGTPA